MALLDDIPKSPSLPPLATSIGATTGKAAPVVVDAGALVSPIGVQPQDAEEALSDAVFKPNSPEEFVRLLTPSALAAMETFAVPASFTIAQGALESGWGKSRLAIDGRNLFGVKADASWTGDIITMYTREFINGTYVMVEAKWRKYPNLQTCLDDHAKFFHNNSRYKDCFQFKDGKRFAKAVADAKYATDPDYANKLIDIIQSRRLDLLDNAS
jgi:flagellar rod assembly protein/muramidase FlgJ